MNGLHWLRPARLALAVALALLAPVALTGCDDDGRDWVFPSGDTGETGDTGDDTTGGDTTERAFGFVRFTAVSDVPAGTKIDATRFVFVSGQPVALNVTPLDASQVPVWRWQFPCDQCGGSGGYYGCGPYGGGDYGEYGATYDCYYGSPQSFRGYDENGNYFEDYWGCERAFAGCLESGAARFSVASSNSVSLEVGGQPGENGVFAGAFGGYTTFVPREPGAGELTVRIANRLYGRFPFEVVAATVGTEGTSP
jgi:hypothetical protein